MEIKRYGAKEFLAAGKLCIRENEIHIWCICWPEMTDFWVNHEYILSGQESEQVGRFRFSEDRMRYIAGKVVVRLLLKRYLDVETIDFSVSERGKPYHKKIAGKQTVDFNISHSGEFILAGFAVGMDIGVDVQEMAGCPDYWEIAGNFYTEEEAEDVIKEGAALFFQYWAAKEAYVKALGIGLGRGMDFFSVRNGKIAEKDKKDQDWFLYPVRIKGYAAYVAAHKKEANQMGYKKDMSKYENLEGWERCGVGEQLDRWAEKYGERTAVTDSEDEISYMELKQKADCLAAAFLRKGILKGDKVLVQLPNRISFVIVFFALSKIGAVPIMMLPAHREAELEGIIELAKPAAYIVAEKYLGFSYVPMANAMKEKYSCIRHIFVDSESGDISGMIAET